MLDDPRINIANERISDLSLDDRRRAMAARYRANTDAYMAKYRPEKLEPGRSQAIIVLSAVACWGAVIALAWLAIELARVIAEVWL